MGMFIKAGGAAKNVFEDLIAHGRGAAGYVDEIAAGGMSNTKAAINSIVEGNSTRVRELGGKAFDYGKSKALGAWGGMGSWGASWGGEVGAGMVRGASVGAGVGALGGAISDDSTMLEGAFKGALAGAAVGGGIAKFRGGSFGAMGKRAADVWARSPKGSLRGWKNKASGVINKKKIAANSAALGALGSPVRKTPKTPRGPGRGQRIRQAFVSNAFHAGQALRNGPKMVANAAAKIGRGIHRAASSAIGGVKMVSNKALNSFRGLNRSPAVTSYKKHSRSLGDRNRDYRIKKKIRGEKFVSDFEKKNPKYPWA